jgi:glucose-6-phosphate dehydrogenase assembly protein OpcA
VVEGPSAPFDRPRVEDEIGPRDARPQAVGDILAVGTRPAGSSRIHLEGGARLGEPTLRWRSRAHSIDEIEKELARIWAEPNLEVMVEGESERHVAARTSVMNLVVVARQPEIGERCAATIQQLTGRHPSRTIICSPADPDGPSWLDAAIQAHCILPREDAPETCAELIYLTVGGESGRHLEAIVAPLLIHDLPVTVWWPGEAPLATEPARDLLAMADRLIVDGASWSGNGLRKLRELAGLLDQTRLAISDFALVRQYRWREAIASIFDLPEFLPYLGGIRRIAVAYGTHDETGAPSSTNIVKPVYHVAWLASRLGFRVVRPLTPVTSHGPKAAKRGGQDGMSKGLGALLRDGRHDVNVVVRPVLSPMPSGTTLRIELLAERRGSELRADVTAVQESVHVRVWLDGVEELDRVFVAPRRSDVDLLAEAIEIGARDKLAVEALQMAAELAGDQPEPAERAAEPTRAASAASMA